MRRILSGMAAAPSTGPPRAVVLDMDGLMLDTETIYRRAWQRAARDLGRSIDDRLYTRFVGRSTADGERILRELFGADLPLADFRRRWLEHWHAEVTRDGIAPKPGLGELLEWLERRRIPVAVATSTPREDARFTLARGGLAERFRIVVSGDQVAAGKPAPDIFLAAAARLGVSPSRCIAIEDSDAGVLAAVAAGMRVIAVPDLAPTGPGAAREAWRVVPSLHAARACLEELWTGRGGPGRGASPATAE